MTETLTARLLAVLMLVAAARPQAHQIRSDWIMQENEYVMAFVNVTYRDPSTQELYYQSGEIGKYSTGLVAVATGRLVLASSRNGTAHHGCDFPWESQVPDEPWIALVRRGLCNFDVKVENAYRSSASGVIIYDYKSSELLHRIHLTSEHRDSIVTVFIKKEQGDDLAFLLDQGIEITMQLTPGKHYTFSVENLNRTSVLFVSMSFILLLVISLAWLLFYYVQRFRYMHAKDRLARHLVSAARKALSKVPLRTLKAGDSQLADGECCAVCLEAYRAADCIRMLPCKHEFHMLCVDPWLLKNRSCPMCKMDIVKHYGLAVVTGDDGVMVLVAPGESSASDQQLPPPSGLPSGGAQAQHWASVHALSSSPEAAPAPGVFDSAPGAQSPAASPGLARMAAAPPAATQTAERPASYSLRMAPTEPVRRASSCDEDDASADDSDSYRSCHLQSVESLASAATGGSPVACRSAAADTVVVVHTAEADESDT